MGRPHRRGTHRWRPAPPSAIVPCEAGDPMIWLWGWVLGAGHAAQIDVEPDGVVLRVKVRDERGRIVPTATVRNPEEGVWHRVDGAGVWRTEALYFADEERPIWPGEAIELSVRAPGYLPVRARYVVRSSRNLVLVKLTPLARVGRGRSAVQWLDGSELACGSIGALGTPEPAFADLQLEPATLRAALHDPSQRGPLVMAALAAQLSGLGPEHATEAIDWARVAMIEARATLQGDAYVDLVDRMHQVRAVAGHLRWQALEAQLLLHPVGDDALRLQAESARRSALQLADDWLDYARAARTDDAFARALCLASAEAPERCR